MVYQWWKLIKQKDEPELCVSVMYTLYVTVVCGNSPQFRLLESFGK